MPRLSLQFAPSFLLAGVGLHVDHFSVQFNSYNTTTDVLDKLCIYFEVDVGDVACYIKSESD